MCMCMVSQFVLEFSHRHAVVCSSTGEGILHDLELAADELLGLVYLERIAILENTALPIVASLIEVSRLVLSLEDLSHWQPRRRVLGYLVDHVLQPRVEIASS